MSQASSATNWQALLSALILPFARFALRHSLSFKELTEAAKAAMIEAAKGEIEREGLEPSVTRIGLMTGIYRDEVSRILGNKKGSPAQAKNMIGRVITQWRTDKRFIDQNGEPRVLSHKGEKSEFWALSRAVSKNLNPASVASEMVRLNYVEKGEQGLKLLRFMQTYVTDPTAGLSLVARDIDALLQAAQENIFERPSVANVHIHTEYDNILAQEIPNIRKEIMRRSREFHKGIREYLSQYDRDINPELPPGTPAKVVVGGFRLTPNVHLSSEDPPPED